MTKQKLSALVLVVVLALSNVFFAMKFIKADKELTMITDEMKAVNAKQPILEFNQLFVDKVLKAENEVSFDTRLELENKVRELKDVEMLDQWNKFVNAEDEMQAQVEVKNLLGLLANKMNVLSD